MELLDTGGVIFIPSRLCWLITSLQPLQVKFVLSEDSVTEDSIANSKRWIVRIFHYTRLTVVAEPSVKWIKNLEKGIQNNVKHEKMYKFEIVKIYMFSSLLKRSFRKAFNASYPN